MTFSNVNVFNNMQSILSASPDKKVGDRITTGGAFAPNTLESVAIMRSNLDNDWETAFIIKYNALMQNRLNRLKQDLQNAYKALIEISTVQQIRENGITKENTALTDINGKLLPGATEAFKGLQYYNNETEFNAADTANGTWADGVPSYWATDPLGVYEMRRLYVTGPALQIVNDMKVTMRTEEVPPKKPNLTLSVPLFGDIDFDNIAELIGSPPYTAGQKVAEYSTEVATGGFWSTVNYLYNFSPREMKYNYVTAYSTTTEEAGTRQVGSGANAKQATLFSGDLTDTRDAEPGRNMNDDVPTYNNSNNKPPVGSRIKWNSSNPSDGYLTEVSPIFGDDIDDRVIHRRAADNDHVFDYLLDDFTNANVTVKSNWDGIRDVTSTYNSVNGATVDRAQLAPKMKIYGSEDGYLIPISERIKWEYEHDGVGAADLNRDGEINDSDVHVAKAAFINHYIIETQTVELNSSSNSRGTIAATENKKLRSNGIDGSAEHAVNNKTGDDFVDPVTGNRIASIVQHDADNDGDYESNDNDINEKLLLAGSGKISKNFDSQFVKNNHSISSFNGQAIATNNADVRISTNNDSTPIVIAEYEGLSRAKAMSVGMAEDYFNNASSTTLSRSSAIELAQKIVLEVNATSMVDTDWHYSEHTDNDSIMFRNITSITATSGTPIQLVDNGIPDEDIHYRDDIRSSSTGSWANVDVAFRKTFTLQGKDFLDASFSSEFANGQVYLNTPQYTNKSVRVQVDTQGASNFELFVNGKLATHVGGGVYEIGHLLKEGDNVIAAQMAFGSSTNSFSITSAATNSAVVDAWVDAKISSDRSVNGDSSLSTLTANNVSSWQSKIMVERETKAKYNTIYPVNGINTTSAEATAEGFATVEAMNAYGAAIERLSTIKTVTTVKEQNAFAKILTDIINRPEYQDIFNLGLINSDIGRTLSLKADVSAPTGGTVAATMDIQYDPVNRKFILVQNKWDAFGGI